jgi:hypothetical protein
MNYEQDIEIDETALDVEWLGQASLTFKYCRHAAEMERVRDQAKENLNITRAEIDQKIRNNPEKYKIEKVTEGSISAAILVHEDYKEANQAYIDAIFELNVAKGAVDAFQDRKKALENLVQLHGQSYFAGPKVPRNIKWEKQEKQKRANSSVAGKMRRVK